MRRYALKRDAAEFGIVEALESVGAKVWRLHQPADLLVQFRGRWWLMEVKTPQYRKRTGLAVLPSLDKRRGKQREFLEATRTPVVMSAMDAFLAIGAFVRDGAVIGSTLGEAA